MPRGPSLDLDSSPKAWFRFAGRRMYFKIAWKYERAAARCLDTYPGINLRCTNSAMVIDSLWEDVMRMRLIRFDRTGSSSVMEPSVNDSAKQRDTSSKSSNACSGI